MNEGSELTTFQNRRGSSNIDLTIVNNQLLTALKAGKSAKRKVTLTIIL